MNNILDLVAAVLLAIRIVDCVDAEKELLGVVASFDIDDSKHLYSEIHGVAEGENLQVTDAAVQEVVALEGED